jgi:orotate phosphoribosyltransferase
VASRHPQLAEALKSKSLTSGDFLLASGRRSNYYIDGKLTSMDPEGAVLIAEAIFEEIANLQVDAIGGMDMGATPIIGALAVTGVYKGRPLPTFVVRKDVKSHGTMKLVEGLLTPNSRVVIVDDVVTSGVSILKAIDAVQQQGCEVLLAISVLDRNAGAAEALERRQIPYQPLVTLRDLGVEDGASRTSSQVGVG